MVVQVPLHPDLFNNNGSVSQDSPGSPQPSPEDTSAIDA